MCTQKKASRVCVELFVSLAAWWEQDERIRLGCIYWLLKALLKMNFVNKHALSLVEFVELCEWQAELFCGQGNTLVFHVAILEQTARHFVMSLVNPTKESPHETPFYGRALSVICIITESSSTKWKIIIVWVWRGKCQTMRFKS